MLYLAELADMKRLYSDEAWVARAGEWGLGLHHDSLLCTTLMRGNTRQAGRCIIPQSFDLDC